MAKKIDEKAERVYFVCNLTKTELAQIDAWFKAQGYTRGGYIRRHLLDVSAIKE